MSERINHHEAGATVYDLEELRDNVETLGGSLTHTDEDLRDYREEQEAATGSVEKPEEADEEDQAEQEPSSKPARRDKAKSRTRAEEYRASQDTNKEMDKHEQWAWQYVRENIDLFSDEYGALVTARERLSEASVKMRRGTATFSSVRAREEFESAKEEYERVREDFLERQLEDLEEPVARKRALTAALSASEDGALMGEEANYYLQKENSRLHNNWEKTKSWYKERGRATKVALGIGATATAGVLGGFVAGGAIAGAGLAYAGRSARIYLGRESGRDVDTRSQRHKQQQATLRASGTAEYFDNYQSLRNLKSKGKKIQAGDLAAVRRHGLDAFLYATKAAGGSDKSETGNSEYFEAAKQSRKEAENKRRSMAWALGGAAVGAGVGAIAETFSDFDGVLRGGAENGTDMDTGGGLSETEQEQLDDAFTERDQALDEREALIDEMDEAEQRVEELESDMTDTDEPEEAPDESAEVTEQSRYLYGEMAGETVDIDIPEGGNVWDQLETVVDENMPNTDYSEKQRLVGNMLNALEEQYPDRDLNLVNPGESLSVTLPS